jgi:hypothetical protein
MMNVKFNPVDTDTSNRVGFRTLTWKQNQFRKSSGLKMTLTMDEVQNNSKRKQTKKQKAKVFL